MSRPLFPGDVPSPSNSGPSDGLSNGAFAEPSRAAKLLLAVAALAIGFAAVDTYVVVLALPAMMTTAGLDITDLQLGAPIISGFLLGYVAILPLIGRISDIRGRIPVLVSSLIVFAVGSLITAAASNLDAMVVGRLLQGIGGGGLIPPTLALVADLYPPHKRGVPLGLVGAVQELGSVLGPVYGAVVLAVGTWRDIFWLNAAGALILMAAMKAVPRDEAIDSDVTSSDDGPATRQRRIDWIGIVLALLAISALSLAMLRPESLVQGLTTGLAFLPIAGQSVLLEPLSLAVMALTVLFLVRQATARDPLLAWRSWGRVMAATDLLGAVFLSVALGAVIVMFASADPEQSGLPDDAFWLIPVAIAAAVAFLWRQRTASEPLIPRGTLGSKAAWGSLIASFFIGSALIAALVDVPLFARFTTSPDSQVGAAKVLLQFLIALPIGAVLGGWLLRWIGAGPLAAAAMVPTVGGFAVMATWGPESLLHLSSSIVLFVTGLGFGLAIAPINDALLGATRPEVHGVASSLLIVGRMVGMLVGISVLTSVGLRYFYSVADKIAPIDELCGSPVPCDAYDAAIQAAGIGQVHVVFVGAAICAAIAGVLALATLPRKALGSANQ